MGRGDSFRIYNYSDDDGDAWQVKLSEAVAEQGGFVAASSIESPWGFNPKNMRHVTGVTESGKRGRIPIADIGNSKYLSGGTFSLGGETYSITGRFGERKPSSYLGG